MGLIQRIRQILQILPDSLNQRVQKCIEIRKEERFVHGKKVEASYDAETDRILLWGRSDISDVDLVIVLMHEIGHFLYHQLLDEKIKKSVIFQTGFSFCNITLEVIAIILSISSSWMQYSCLFLMYIGKHHC